LSELKNVLEPQRLTARFLRSLALLATLHTLPITVASADEASTPTQGVPRLPHIKSLGNIYYPDKAKRLNLEGSVLAEFSIDATGRATEVKLVRADNPLFADMAMKGFSASKYEVTADWKPEDAAMRFRVVMVFCLPPSNQATTFNESPYDPIIVAGSRIGHPPVETIRGTCKEKK
jgi:Gram-negative bacterial TonB protein C-terminal